MRQQLVIWALSKPRAKDITKSNSIAYLEKKTETQLELKPKSL